MYDRYLNTSNEYNKFNCMVNKILNGEKPENIPVRFMTDPSDSDLLFDLDAAKNCGITIPEVYLSKANMIFENGKLTKK